MPRRTSAFQLCSQAVIVSCQSVRQEHDDARCVSCGRPEPCERKNRLEMAWLGAYQFLGVALSIRRFPASRGERWRFLTVSHRWTTTKPLKAQVAWHEQHFPVALSHIHVLHTSRDAYFQFHRYGTEGTTFGQSNDLGAMLLNRTHPFHRRTGIHKGFENERSFT